MHDVRFVAQRHNSSQVLDKYKSKLEEKAKKEGKQNVDELKEAYKDKIDNFRKNAIVPGANAPLSAQQPPTPVQTDSSIPYQPPPPPEPQQAQQNPSALPNVPKVPGRKDGVKILGSFIDVDKTSELPDKEIETIWRLRHVKDPQSLCATMQAETFRRIMVTARKHPQFILPLPREEQGAEIHFLQWTFPSETTATVLLSLIHI